MASESKAKQALEGEHSTHLLRSLRRRPFWPFAATSSSAGRLRRARRRHSATAAPAGRQPVESPPPARPAAPHVPGLRARHPLPSRRTRHPLALPPLAGAVPLPLPHLRAAPRHDAHLGRHGPRPRRRPRDRQLLLQPGCGGGRVSKGRVRERGRGEVRCGGLRGPFGAGPLRGMGLGAGPLAAGREAAGPRRGSRRGPFGARGPEERRRGREARAAHAEAALRALRGRPPLPALALLRSLNMAGVVSTPPRRISWRITALAIR
jgi:hypothetical protein